MDYSEHGLQVRIKLGTLQFTIYPIKLHKKKVMRGKPDTSIPEKKKPGVKVNSWALIQELLPMVGEAASRLKRKIRVDRLDLDLTIGASTPALAAIAFGGANAALGMLIPVLENHFEIKERRIRTRCNFNHTQPEAELSTAFSLTIGQGVVMMLNLGTQALRTYVHQTDKQKEAV